MLRVKADSTVGNAGMGHMAVGPIANGSEARLLESEMTSVIKTRAFPTEDPSQPLLLAHR